MPNSSDNDTVLSVLILAGGAGRRMGGRDKGLINWRGKPLIEHVLARAPNGAERLISCNRHLDDYAEYGRPIIDAPSEKAEDYPGPLAGILAGLNHCTGQNLLLLPCDSPNPPIDLYPRLARAQPPQGISYAHDGGRDQYLFALISPAAAPSLANYLAGGARSVKGWYQQEQAVAVDFSECPERFVNFNTVADMDV